MRVSVWIVSVVVLSATTATSVRGANLNVVFAGQVVSVDTRQEEVVRRRDTIEYVRPALAASLDKSRGELIIHGEAADTTRWCTIRVRASDLRIQCVEPLADDPWKVETREPVEDLPLPNGNRIVASKVECAGESRLTRRMRVIDGKTNEAVSERTMAAGGDSSPYEEIVLWALSRNGDRLWVISGAGQKSPYYFREYLLPELEQSWSVSLLEIFDDTPIALVEAEE